MSKLYIVATPVGNLGDITLRALEVLKSVDLILCEDTRVTRRLLEKYEINKPTLSYHSQSRLGRVGQIVEMFRDGKDLALVSDAGTPTVSDPGSFLISKIRHELGDSAEIVPVPGSSAVVAALSASGLPADSFLFLGFLPHKKGRQTLFREIRDSKRTIVFYESPHRFIKTLEWLAAALTTGRKIVVCRELTKIYEEIKVGSAAELLDYYRQHKEKVKGEFVVVVSSVK